MAWEPEGTWYTFAGSAGMGSFGQARVQFWSALVLDSAEARRKLVQKKIKQAGGGWTGWWLQCWAQKIPEELMARSWR